MATKMTLEQLLMREADGDLMDIYLEIVSCIVPASGYAHKYCRKVNKMIDQGKLCINQTTYRKVYLPTLSRAVMKELSRRYIEALSVGMLESTDVAKEVM